MLTLSRLCESNRSSSKELQSRRRVSFSLITIRLSIHVSLQNTGPYGQMLTFVVSMQSKVTLAAWGYGVRDVLDNVLETFRLERFPLRPVAFKDLLP